MIGNKNTMSKVHIIVCLCPNHHLIHAHAFEEKPTRREVDEFKSDITGALITKQMLPWCELCGANSESWKTSVRETLSTSLGGILPELGKIHAPRRRAEQVLKELGVA